jgi:hypothetical protein
MTSAHVDCILSQAFAFVLFLLPYASHLGGDEDVQSMHFA